MENGMRNINLVSLQFKDSERLNLNWNKKTESRSLFGDLTGRFLR